MSKGDKELDIQEKLRILAGAAKYDVSCSSSGSKRKNELEGIGNAAVSGICHSFSADGRCISLLKILLTNSCIYDCVYCINRSSNDIPRATFTPEEAADLTINFYKRNYIEGLFLSSAIIRNPNHTMEQIYRTIELLRNKLGFHGYIHVKAIPGADNDLIRRTGLLVDRMSVNIELPSATSLKLLAPQKDASAILKPMSYIANRIIENKADRQHFKRAPSFVPAGQSTQLIIGATPDSDSSILHLSESLYKSYGLRRVYYSAYMPVNHGPALPEIVGPPLIRENRLYQADWLLRFYGFSAKELFANSGGNLDLNYDPKADWALRNMEQFPVEVNKASREMLLRVPGIGLRSVSKILTARSVGQLDYDDLKKMGIVLKRARFFITCKGSYYSNTSFKEDTIRSLLKPEMNLNFIDSLGVEQLSLFREKPTPYLLSNPLASLTGEL